MMADRQALAWIGVFDGEPDPEFIWRDEAKARRWIDTRPGVELAPLFVAPALTNAERESIWAAARIIDAYDEEIDGFPSGAAARLRKLLERLG